MQDTYRDQSAMVEEVAKCATRNVLQEKLGKLYSTNQTGESARLRLMKIWNQLFMRTTM